MSWADRRRMSATWPFVRSARADHTHAAAPATIGEAKLVPEAGVVVSAVPSGSKAGGTSTGTPSPGAETSMAAFALLKNAGWRLWLIAATLTTCGHAAG